MLARQPALKIVDLSADFRLADPAAYARWYGHEHFAPELQPKAVYGLTEIYRKAIATAQLVANPGCYTSCAELALIPLLKAKVIDPDEIVIDAKSGVTGAGRGAREDMQFAEVSEGFHAYGVGHHRHMAELDQEFSLAAGRPVKGNLYPASRADELRPAVNDLRAGPQGIAAGSSCDTFKVLRERAVRACAAVWRIAATRHVRGSNMTFIGVAADRVAGRAIIGSALDNLTKGASGQAVQNMNLMLGFPETAGLEQVALFP